MGSKDYRHRETKKNKKTAKKPVIIPPLVPQQEVEVIARKSKRAEDEETEE